LSRIGGLFVGNDFEKDELQVEHYDADAAAAKKKKIQKRVAIGVGAAALLVLLGYFGLLYVRDLLMTEYIMGGNGAWFNSKVRFLEDGNG
jgi:hypothetical protein